VIIISLASAQTAETYTELCLLRMEKKQNYCELCGTACKEKFYIRRGINGVPKPFCIYCFDHLSTKTNKEIGRILKKNRKPYKQE